MLLLLLPTAKEFLALYMLLTIPNMGVLHAPDRTYIILPGAWLAQFEGFLREQPSI
jgi:hypothetical protein